MIQRSFLYVFVLMQTPATDFVASKTHSWNSCSSCKLENSWVCMSWITQITTKTWSKIQTLKFCERMLLIVENDRSFFFFKNHVLNAAVHACKMALKVVLWNFSISLQFELKDRFSPPDWIGVKSTLKQAFVKFCI